MTMTETDAKIDPWEAAVNCLSRAVRIAEENPESAEALVTIARGWLELWALR